ncbi:hypothetical protein VNO77_27338 [Canavalia gladiata]|uniref:Uncharacterized protein n=1 Tax=Canavalia gladiata TaxID=3824 RepID=A0AAN9KWS4_CANGL
MKFWKVRGFKCSNWKGRDLNEMLRFKHEDSLVGPPTLNGFVPSAWKWVPMQRSPLLPEVAVDVGLSCYILHTLQPGFLAYRFAFVGRIIGEQGEHTEGSPERVGLGLPAWNLHTLHIPHIHDSYRIADRMYMTYDWHALPKRPLGKASQCPLKDLH